MANPTQNYFTLFNRSNSNALLFIKVVDRFGRTVQTKRSIAANGTLQLGSEYGKGIYFAEIQQGNKKVMVKLIKVSK